MASLPVVDFDAVKKAVASGDVVILDVRGIDELKEGGKIKSANHLPITELPKALVMTTSEFKEKYGFDKPTKGKHYSTYCKMGGRALRAAEALVASEMVDKDKVSVYKGSFTDWTAKQGELEKI